MARTPLAQHLQSITRRDLLKAGAAATAAAARPAVPARAAGNTPRIAVVGGGLAGLSAAYRLQQAGYASTVYEGSDRVGGRCWTGRGAFAEGQIYEHGGELIDQSHTA